MRLKQLLVVIVAIVALSSCRRAKPKSDDSSATKELSTTGGSSANDDVSERACERPIAIYDGSVMVNGSDYVHLVARGNDFVDEPIADLDRVLTKSTRVRFTLDYPFDRPFAGVVTGEITLRRTIDAIRAGFRQMYADTTEREIPGMMNKDVTGPYGAAIHVIDDLVIERIDLCAEDTFAISIGS